MGPWEAARRRRSPDAARPASRGPPDLAPEETRAWPDIEKWGPANGPPRPQVTVDHLAKLKSLAALMAGEPEPDTLAEMLAGKFPPRPAWMRDALCRERPRTDFFPQSRADEGGARSTCRECLVREECLNFALDHGERGIWGGTNEEERRRMRPPLPVAVRCATCAGWFDSPRGHAAYCSATCRTKAAKARNRRSA